MAIRKGKRGLIDEARKRAAMNRDVAPILDADSKCRTLINASLLERLADALEATCTKRKEQANA